MFLREVGAGAGDGEVAGGGVGGDAAAAAAAEAAVVGGGAMAMDLGAGGRGGWVGEEERPREVEGCPRAAARKACWAFAMENKGGLFIAGRRWEKRSEEISERRGGGGEEKGAEREEERRGARGVTEGSSTATRACRW